MYVEGDMDDEGAYAAIIKVREVQVTDGNTAKVIYDDVICVASVKANGEVAGPAHMVEGQAGVLCIVEG